ncbi:enoyl-CoA hydratase/isomerase family protein [Ramlibacter sp. USB13]|uniref:Enoyl-CoA hydratase/isomerase family protein n=1 Tax=Ramlibacter cellulosilyticus TaxID=2764187 RepID=A0A923MPY9_9BURK|nr:enoyl-CoA hydratase-related protein [Ramlibacter cellulosilyticus]MBC5783083.1 enoyl-CoA hydratase/isomerase family protein [Ramlibacter cellulosilyticus]
MSGQVRLALLGPVARVTLSHPGKLDAMSRAMWRELRDAFLSLQANRDLRCVVVAGANGGFCAGGDIAEYPQFRFHPETLRQFHEEDVWGGLAAMLACEVPVVAQIEGACMGAGLEIACCCDIRIAGAGARFGAPIARLGFPMAPREAQLVAAVAGAATLREMLFEAVQLDAREMKARGFLQRVVPNENLALEVQATADRISALAPQAARMNKRTLRRLDGRAADAPPPADLLERAYDYATSPEHREGISAFLEKRSPQF